MGPTYHFRMPASYKPPCASCHIRKSHSIPTVQEGFLPEMPSLEPAPVPEQEPRFTVDSGAFTTHSAADSAQHWSKCCRGPTPQPEGWDGCPPMSQRGH